MLGLGAIDILVLLPILLWIAGVLLAFFVAAGAFVIAGAICAVAGPFVVTGAPPAAMVLTGLGLMAAAVCLGSLGTIGCTAGTHALVWYGRLHLRLLKPALDSQGLAA